MNKKKPLRILRSYNLDIKVIEQLDQLAESTRTDRNLIIEDALKEHFKKK